MDFLKRKLPIIIVFCTGMLMIIAFYVPHKPFNQIWDGANHWTQIIRSFTLVIAVFSLIRNHYRKIRLGKEGWGYSGVMFLVLAVTAVFGLMQPMEGSKLFGSKSGSLYMWIFDYLNQSAAATVFSLLAFYIASAAYRAFRVRTLEATVMLITALIVMIGRVPWGEQFSNFITESINQHLVFLRLDKLTSFFLNYPTAAAKKAIFIGIALASVATSLRIILGIERTYMGGDD
jgi:hypothetical protein